MPRFSKIAPVRQPRTYDGYAPNGKNGISVPGLHLVLSALGEATIDTGHAPLRCHALRALANETGVAEGPRSNAGAPRAGGRRSPYPTVLGPAAPAAPPTRGRIADAWAPQ